MLAMQHDRPPRLYLYGPRPALERALELGEFRLQPLAAPTLEPHPQAAFLVLDLTHDGSQARLHALPATHACLAIHDPEEFGERLHRAVHQALPAWAGIDAAISYGHPSPLGKAFTAAASQEAEQIWRFAWRPAQAVVTIAPVFVRVGNIESIAELRTLASH